MNLRATYYKTMLNKKVSVLQYIYYYTIQNIEDYKVYNEIRFGTWTHNLTGQVLPVGSP